MPKDPEKFARLFGAKHVVRVPDVGGGPFGMAQLAHLMHKGLTPAGVSGPAVRRARTPPGGDPNRFQTLDASDKTPDLAPRSLGKEARM